MRRLSLLIVCSLLVSACSCSWTSQGQESDASDSLFPSFGKTVHFDLNPQGSKFPILGYGCPCTPQAYEDMASCGFTLCIPERINLKEHLDASRGSGVKISCYINVDPLDPFGESDQMGLRDWDRFFLENYKDDPQVAMWEIADEPITVHKSWNVARLRNAVAAVREIDCAHPIYINWGAVPNNPYWDSSMSEFYSFDHFPLKYYDIPAAKSNWYFDTYYGRTWTRWVCDNVQACELAYKNDSFWNGMAASMRFDGTVPEVEERHLRLAQFGNLACGAQMLSYYRYMNFYTDGTHDLRPYETGQYEGLDGKTYQFPEGVQHGAPVNWDGSHNESWQMVKDVNEEINSLAGLFLGMKVKTASVLNSDRPELKSFDDFSDNLRISVPSDERLLVSRFTNAGHEYIMCLNYWSKLDVHPTIKVGKDVVRILSDTLGEEVPAQSYSPTLPVGDYLIFQIK